VVGGLKREGEDAPFTWTLIREHDPLVHFLLKPPFPFIHLGQLRVIQRQFDEILFDLRDQQR